jgi:hypothetical protein
MSTDTATATGREILARALGHANFSPREIHALATEMGATRGAIVCMMDTATAVQTDAPERCDGRVLIRWAQGRD